MNMPSQIRDPLYSACLGALAPTDGQKADRATLSSRAVRASTLAMAGYRTSATAGEQATTGVTDTARRRCADRRFDRQPGILSQPERHVTCSRT